MRSRPGCEKGSPGRALFYAAVLLPYVAVAGGLFLLHRAWAAMLGYQLGMWLLIVIARAPKRDPGIRAAPGRLVAATLVAGLAGGPLAAALWPWAARLPAGALAAWLAGLGIGPRAWPWFVAYLCLTTPLLEEHFWRAWLGRSRRPALETAAWFAGYHLLVLMPVLRPAWLVLAFVSLALAGWTWQLLLRFRNGFLWAVFSHSIADVSVMLAAGWILRG